MVIDVSSVSNEVAELESDEMEQGRRENVELMPNPWCWREGTSNKFPWRMPIAETRRERQRAIGVRDD